MPYLILVRAHGRRVTRAELSLWLAGLSIAAFAIHDTATRRDAWLARRSAALCYSFQCRFGAVLTDTAKPREMRRKALAALCGPGSLSERFEKAGDAVDEVLLDYELARQTCVYRVEKGALTCVLHGTPKRTGDYPAAREPACTGPVVIPPGVEP